MTTLDLSRVDRKAPRPVEARVLFVPFWSYSKPHTKAQLERPNRPAQLDHQLVIKGETYRNFLREASLWSGVYVRVKPLDNSPLETNWETTFIGHKVELEWRLKVFPSTSNLLFWISPHQGTLSCSQILKIT